jgi:hypothetical protein
MSLDDRVYILDLRVIVAWSQTYIENHQIGRFDGRSKFGPSHMTASCSKFCKIQYIQNFSFISGVFIMGDYQKLAVKKYARLPSRQTSESRFWKKFKVTLPECTVMHIILNMDQSHALYFLFLSLLFQSKNMQKSLPLASLLSPHMILLLLHRLEYRYTLPKPTSLRKRYLDSRTQLLVVLSDMMESL